MVKKLADILAEKGLDINFQYGGKAPEEMVGREIKKEPFPRVKKLKEQYYNTLSSATMEFPYWYTRKYRELEGEIPVVRRAAALKHAFSHITPTIWPGELLVGGKAFYYRGSFPMPWLSEGYYMAKEDELYKSALERGSVSAGELSKFGSGGGNVVQSFGNVTSIAGKFGLRNEEVGALVKCAKEWVGKSVDDLGHKYEQMVPEYDIKEKVMRSLVCMFDSGYTLPLGREVINYYYPLQYGFDGLIKMAKEKKAEVAGRADGDGLIGMDRLYFYEAVILVLEGIQAWIRNYAKEARRLAAECVDDAQQKKEYEEIAEIMDWISSQQPRTFREALQLTYLIHIAVLNEDAISGMSPGRLGQVLWPWFEQDMEAGRIDEGQVLELLECHRMKFTCIDCFASTGVVGGVLSGNTFNNLSMGGLTRDGRSAANRLEMLIMEAGMTNETTQPTLSVLYDEKLPEDFLLKAVECNKTGTGYPAWMNNQNAIQFLLKQYGSEGMTLEEARAIAIGGCLETSPCAWHELTLNGKTYWIPGGAGQPTSVGVHFIANPKVLELVLFNGYDHRTKEQVLPPHNKKLETYEELWDTFKEYYEIIVDALTTTNNIQHDIWRKHNMSIFHSLCKPDCLEKGHHIGNLGIRYNATFNVESCGQINQINALVALKKLVYEEKKYSLDEMRQAILDNFGFKTAAEVGSFSLAAQEKKEDGDKYDKIHSDCLKAPKYGNDDPYADAVLKEYEDWFCDMCTHYESLYGKPLYSCQISVSTHGPQGAATLASADGRLAGTTYADGSMSAYPGTDRNGPYALFTSATVWDQAQSQNSQMNLKIHPNAVRGLEGSKKLLELTRAYMRRGGFHIQYNIVDSKILKDAQAHPEGYRDLMVRVAGFTQYWVEIGKPIQDEVIARTEYEGI
ncbi:4-hydroxyphenylacetate decarboxylase large subunit [Thermanaerosceptrum fracticalcis]|uniref:4-hydroxyphenylacetate decarboxylase large subunit n=1 Tax=Thermanaerosceptrum fracticalcis TaxID=1712410 RepID=A0A7G6E266_THEFR|nr:4-hydroxyphenylacetate decarboxylase large subunit [Thermanaerosceptrum fracticalcis]QNB46170.1 4-hydroxyphenylacetate decarboxylase large subunit [Thermanaerosceptrum fracticalcis]